MLGNCVTKALMQGHEVNALMSSNNQAGYSNFTYWVPAPPPPPPGQASDSILDSSDSDQPLPIGVSNCYPLLSILVICSADANTVHVLYICEAECKS